MNVVVLQNPAARGDVHRATTATVARLRAAGHSAETVAAVLTQLSLRAKAAAKLGPQAWELLLTRSYEDPPTWAQLFDDLPAGTETELAELYDALPEGAQTEYAQRYGTPAQA